MNLRLATAATIALAAFAGACSFRHEKDRRDAEDADASLYQGAVSYAQVNDRVFRPLCMSCHSNLSPSFDTYDRAFAARDLIRAHAIERKDMPPTGPLKGQELALLTAWLDEGAPEEPRPRPSPSPSPAPRSVVTWKQVNEKVLQVSCTSCHFANNDKDISDLTDVKQVRDTMGTILFVTIVTPTMPPAPDQLSREQKALLSDWAIDGMKD